MKDTQQSIGTDQPTPVDDEPAAAGWSTALTGLDLFWPVLATVLVIAVVFVASVAHNSMDSVGAVGSVGTPLPKPSVSSTVPPTVDVARITIVQVSSHPGRAAALAAAQRLAGRGVVAHVLDSDEYQPMNPGYFVVYAGPYPATTDGRAEARRTQAKLPGSKIREVTSRTP